MNTTIKSMAMVAVALFAGFGSASAQEESADDGVELTKDMFHIWDGLTKDAQPTDEHVYMDWNVFMVNVAQTKKVKLPNLVSCSTVPLRRVSRLMVV